MSSLNDFIKNNRKEFDQDLPSENVWDRIEEQLPSKTKVIRLRPVWMNAAASLVLMVVSLTVYEYQVRGWLVNDALVSEQTELMEERDEAYYSFIETEAYYNQQVNGRMVELTRLTKNYPDLENDIAMELKELDVMLNELKMEVENGGDSELLVQAMLKNYKTRVSLIEGIIETLKEDNHEMEI